MAAKRKPRVLIAGGGVAGIEALLALNDLAGDRVEIELVAPESEYVYQPLAVVAPLDVGEPPRFDLSAIARDLGAEYRTGHHHVHRSGSEHRPNAQRRGDLL